MPPAPWQRFVSKCRPMKSGCIRWIAGSDLDNYGRFKDGRNWQAHRWIWVRERGPVPPGMEVHHTCHNHRCVNLNHLELQPVAVNRSVQRRRRAG